MREVGFRVGSRRAMDVQHDCVPVAVKELCVLGLRGWVELSRVRVSGWAGRRAEKLGVEPLHVPYGHQYQPYGA